LEIAEEFGLSRHKVARRLLKARESSVARSPSKRRAIAAALASGLIDSLVTDVSTAHSLLAAIDTNNRATGHHLKSPSMANPKEEELT
jgi:DNA-binding transcriptional regulator LsrR (DeoR family)